MQIQAAPIVVNPSGDFVGDDGPWSSFLIDVGSPPQQVQVLVSTEVSSTWVVAPGACGPAYPVNCTGARGGAYDSTKSSTWNANANYTLNAETNLGNPYSAGNQIGSYGYETIGVPGQSEVANVSVNHQVIAAIETNTYYLGSLGLSSRNITFPADSSNTSPSFLGSLRNENLIPSLSFGYTAGASYRQNGTNGSLTLGGYDASRFIPNDVSFTFGPLAARQLVVGLQSVTYSNSTTQTSLLSQGINALVDSTVPYLWLPESTCEAFQEAFGLTLDPIHNLYTVNESSHVANLKQNASIVFQLTNSLTEGGPSINITLPYASFDLVATAPLVSSQTRYFPLQRGNDDTQYTLGRTFLQESFLIVDYEQSNFSISQATFDTSVPSHIVAISHATTTGNTIANPTSSNTPIVKITNNGSHGIGTGAIAGIAIAIVLIATLCGSFFIVRSVRRKRQSRKLAMAPVDEPKTMSDFESDHKHDFSDEPEVKKNTTTIITVDEVPMTPPLSEADGNEFFTPFGEKQRPQSRIMELPAEPVDRSEMPSPSPEELRSELSTPEPKWNYPELPSPDPSQELPSPGLSSAEFGDPSPELDHRRSPSLEHRRSALTSPEPRLQRPRLSRGESSESEAGWTRDGMPTGPFHRRYQSDDSDTPSISTRPRSSRIDSSDSDAFIHSNRIDESSAESESPSSFTRPTMPHVGSSESESPMSSPSISSSASRQRSIRMDSGSESENAITPATPARGGVSSTFHSSSSPRPATTFRSSASSRPGIRRQSAVRPMTHRTLTGDSDTWETRLESPSESSMVGSRFGSIVIRHQRGESAGNLETREGLLDGENVTRQNQ